MNLQFKIIEIIGKKINDKFTKKKLLTDKSILNFS